MNLKNYFRELKRRNVFKAALAYLVVGWVIIQVSAIVFPAFKAPPVILKTIIIVLIIGFPVWLIFAWIYEVTPDGLKKTKNIDQQDSIAGQTSNKMNKLILSALGIAIALLCIGLFDRFSSKNASEKGSEIISKTSDPDSSPENTEKSIAVLAFEDMSPQQDQEYFSDGISEEILNHLAKIPQMQVTSRTSSFSYEDSKKNIKTIAEELGVEYILEGSVRKSGDKIRITAKLISENGTQIWAQTFDRTLEEIFKIQDEIAKEVTRNLKITVFDGEIRKTSTEVYNLYLKAKHLSQQTNKKSVTEAMELLKRATEIDPNYAPAWGLMSYLYYFKGFSNTNMPKDKAYELGLEAAKKAIEADPDYALGYYYLAVFNRIAFDFKKLKNNLDIASELQPGNSEKISNYGLYTFQSVEEIIQDVKKSIEIDPLNYQNYFRLGFQLFWNGKNQEAMELMKKYEKFVPDAVALHATKAEILLAMGKLELAKKEIEKEISPYFKQYIKIKVLHQAGKEEEAKKLLDFFIEKYPEEAANIADIYAFMGKREKTFEWLNRALVIKDPTILEIIYYPTFKKFHQDPRWQELIEDMGVPENNGIPGYE